MSKDAQLLNDELGLEGRAGRDFLPITALLGGPFPVWPVSEWPRWEECLPRSLPDVLRR